MDNDQMARRYSSTTMRTDVRINTRSAVQRGNIHRDRPVEEGPGLYQANGLFGCVWSAYGLHAPEARQAENPTEGRSQLMHMEHWGRFRFYSEATEGETCADYILPLIRLNWDPEPEVVRNYHQKQDFYNGTVYTTFAWPKMQGQIRMHTWFDPVDRSLLCIQLRSTCKNVRIKIRPVTTFIPYPFLYKKKTRQTVGFVKTEDGWRISVACPDAINQTVSEIYVQTDGDVLLEEDALTLAFAQGVHSIRISYGRASKTTSEDSERQTKVFWNRLWNESAVLELADDSAQKVWVRSLAYLLATYKGTPDKIQPTNGLTGNMFPFHFVQDMAYIAPALIMSGHADIVRGWVEKLTGQMEAMKRYARRLWPQTEGIYPPWELPYGDIDGYHQPNVPVVYCYEPHNVAYLCRMAAEAAMSADREWTVHYARPIIRECAAFYASAAEKRDDGLWHLHWYPCVGQDEAGGRNGEDYLCSLYSAKYCFNQAVRFGFREYETYLSDGLAFPVLLSESGVLHTLPGADDFGRQKHPVQLDGIAFMPAEKSPLGRERAAFQMRSFLTERAEEPFFFGWTLGEFLLAGSNMSDRYAYEHDWLLLRHSNLTDPEWIQFYETSGEAEKSFYLTTHGMILQSMYRWLINDYWGKEMRGQDSPFGDAAFERLRYLSGRSVSGRIENKQDK